LAAARLIPIGALVPESGVEAARAMLMDAGLAGRVSGSGRPDPRQVALVVGGIFGTGGFIALLVWVISHL